MAIENGKINRLHITLFCWGISPFVILRFSRLCPRRINGNAGKVEEYKIRRIRGSTPSP